jgi:hypothetical protein
MCACGFDASGRLIASPTVKHLFRRGEYHPPEKTMKFYFINAEQQKQHKKQNPFLKFFEKGCGEKAFF